MYDRYEKFLEIRRMTEENEDTNKSLTNAKENQLSLQKELVEMYRIFNWNIAYDQVLYSN